MFNKGKDGVIVHGLWPCNKVGDKLTPLRNSKPVSEEIHDKIVHMVNFKEVREFRKSYWKAIFGSPMKFRIYQCITHNIYKEKIMNVNYCNDMARLASKFLVEEGRYNLPQLMI